MVLLLLALIIEQRIDTDLSPHASSSIAYPCKVIHAHPCKVKLMYHPAQFPPVPTGDGHCSLAVWSLLMYPAQLKCTVIGS